MQQDQNNHWLRSHLSFFYHSKWTFTMVNRFFNVTGVSHFTMVNASLVCCVSNRGRMKAKFTIVKPSQKAWYIVRLSKLCLFRWHLVMNFEKHFMTWLNLHYMHVLSISFTSNLLTISPVNFCDYWNFLCHVRQLFAQFSFQLFVWSTAIIPWIIGINLFIQKSTNANLKTAIFLF